jgi:hypothetical protein
MGGAGFISGDAYATGIITATNVTGQDNGAVAAAPVEWPGLLVAEFSPAYYIELTPYSVTVVDANIHPSGSFNPGGSNPAGIRYCNKDLELAGGVNITGMLIVNGNLRVTAGSSIITSVKNFPALLVTGELKMENAGTLEVNGLAQIGQRVLYDAAAVNADITVLGGLFIATGGVDGLGSGVNSINITTSPPMASVEVWSHSGTARRWSPAAGAFYKNIQRN